ncbi:MAG: sigma-70 family RNA polymerase sigma factor [[Clostridium] sporosphaeroides]|uniref:Sigma-70 family RNA polymerase sigma factor n=1 Tax=Faecalispora sporosphaeroides TaxID=1549 RepID=A0A928KT74_9FIRM|nr:sigma-70 family RNA polymerase sigma factor [Faecalispora sporosphaeroides]
MKGGEKVTVIDRPEDAVDRYGALVYRLAAAQTQNFADAEDVFQEVFLRLVRNKKAFESDEHLKSWLIRVTINCSRSLWRTAFRSREVSIAEKDLLAAEVGIPADHSEVYDSVMRLPSKYRAVVHLYYYEDMSLQDIGNALNIGYSAAAKRLSRARILLKQELTEGERYEEFSDGIPESSRCTPHSK